MLSRIISPILIASSRKLVPICFILCGLVSSCSPTPAATPNVPPQTDAMGNSTPDQAEMTDTAQVFSSDRLGLCFSYPQGYTQIPYNDTVEIAAPVIGPGDEAGLFWLEIFDPQNRTAEQVAEEEVKSVAGLNPGRWTVTLGGETAVVMDGMPGQNLVRRVYIVHEQRLYILTFMPTRSTNTTANDQMEALYTAVTSSWSWSPCPAGE